MSNGLPDVEVTLVVKVVERRPRAVVGPLRKMRQDEDPGGSCHTPLLSARHSLCIQDQNHNTQIQISRIHLSWFLAQVRISISTELPKEVICPLPDVSRSSKGQ